MKRLLTSLLLACFVLAGFFGAVRSADATGGGPDTPTCPFSPETGRAILFFSADLRADKTAARAQSSVVAASLPFGTYTVHLASFDDHSNKPGQIQPHESWFVKLLDGEGNEIARTPAISDLPDAAESIVEIVSNDFALTADAESAIAVHAAYPSSNAESIRALCAAFDRHEEPQPEPVLGSITVCKIITGEDNVPSTGADKSGAVFSVAGLDFDGNGAVSSAVSVIPTTTFSTPLSLNTDLLGNDSASDAQCVTHENLSMGSYFYDAEQRSTTTMWNTPRYNDQNTRSVEGVNDFFPYSGELFTEDGSDDAARNTDADGHILLTEGRLHRTLVVLNTFEEEEESEENRPQCSDEADNDLDLLADAADPGCHTDGNKENTDSYNPEGADENSKPVIILVGNATTTVMEGDGFTDPGATAADEEDGDITTQIVTRGAIHTNTPGTYTKTYNVVDSDGAAADEKARTIIVEARPSSGEGAPPQVSTVSGGGGGGDGGSRITLEITNEAISLNAEGAAVVTWNTNLQATSQVLYDTVSRGSTTTIPSQSAYMFHTATSTVFVASHRMTITGLAANSVYYFRPVSARADESVIGKELRITPATTTEAVVVSAPATITRLPAPEQMLQPCQEYLLRYIKIGESNDPLEVQKLETFLNVFEGFSLPVDGVYDKRDFDAVGVFQERYFDDVLRPWGHTERTGYVYFTTRKKINEIVCHRPFPLDTAQRAEVERFRSLLEELRRQSIPPETVIDTGSVGKTEEEKDVVIVQQNSESAEPTGTEGSLLEHILAQPTEQAEQEESKGLTARILDAVDEQSRIIGVVLIILAFLIMGVGMWKSRKRTEQNPPYPPIT